MIRYLFILGCMVLLLSPMSAHAEGMSVAQAYKALRHQQTTFDRSVAQMSAEDAKYLDHLFFVTDMAFRERMMMLSYFRSKKDARYIEKYNKEIGNLLASFEFIQPPTRTLQKVQDIVLSAITDQRSFFNEWHKARGTQKYNNLMSNYARDSKVQSSHKKLIKAYGVLKATYPREGRHNMQSFFDHLCALDFI